MKHLPVYLLTITLFLLSACTTVNKPNPDTLQVVATTSILADVVQQVGGEFVQVSSLVPVGVNEHEYQPGARDIASVADADLVFEVGLGLEEFMSTMISNAGSEIAVITVSEGITPRHFEVENGEAFQDEHSAGDPHVWWDPDNVVIWTQNIAAALAEADPQHSADYAANSAQYINRLHELDTWISTQSSRVPPERRSIVTDHMLFGYFAEKYGYEVIGAVIPSYSSSAQPSAKDLAALEDSITQFGVKAILVGNTVNPALARRVAEDTGVQLVQFYSGSLSDTEGPAATYVEYMEYNVNAILGALED